MMNSLSRTLRGGLLLASLTLLSLVTGCNKSSQGVEGAPPPAEVGVITIAPENVALSVELPGRLEAIRVAEVRARVGGILLKKSFTEGGDVKEGDILFEIDPAPFRAAVNSAKAAVARAEATLLQTSTQEERYKKLLNGKAISKQEYDNAVASEAVAKADLLSAKANLETAELNLGYATVRAPISGYIGRAAVTEGALVGQNEVTKLAVIQELDRIYFDFAQSTTDWLRLKQALQEGRVNAVDADKADVTLMLENGSIFPHKGHLLFSDVTVDPSTGSVTLRAEFPNPDRMLLPGMFGRVRLTQANAKAVVTVPQRAMTRGAAGTSRVLVVTPEKKVEVRSVRAGQAVGDRWVILDGLKEGEQIIVEGFQKVRPGGEVKPVPFQEKKSAAPSKVAEKAH